MHPWALLANSVRCWLCSAYSAITECDARLGFGTPACIPVSLAETESSGEKSGEGRLPSVRPSWKAAVFPCEPGPLVKPGGVKSSALPTPTAGASALLHIITGGITGRDHPAPPLPSLPSLPRGRQLPVSCPDRIIRALNARFPPAHLSHGVPCLLTTSWETRGSRRSPITEQTCSFTAPRSIPIPKRPNTAAPLVHKAGARLLPHRNVHLKQFAPAARPRCRLKTRNSGRWPLSAADPSVGSPSRAHARTSTHAYTREGVGAVN